MSLVFAYEMFLISGLILCFGCKDRKQGKKEEGAVKINVDVNKTTEAHFFEWFSDVEVIPLETTENSLLHNNNKFIPHNGRYYIRDSKQSSVFVFDDTGKFLYSTLFYKGEGPEDCIGAYDFAINPITGNLEILIPHTLTIQARDAVDGQFIKNIKLPASILPLHIFEPVSDDLYLFYANPIKSNEAWVRLFSVKENKIIKRMFENQKSNCIPGSYNVFYRHNGSLYFSFAFNNADVYRMDENMDFKPFVSYNYGRYTFSFLLFFWMMIICTIWLNLHG